jgi:transcriptional regulator with XRE-family HTH domain
MRNLNQIISALPSDRRAKVLARGRQLIAEEMALQQVRKARKLTQERMAELLNIGQDSVSRIENRSDLLLSTLRSYVEAMGGSMKLVVEFPDGARAVLSGLGEATADSNHPPQAPEKAARGRSRRPLALARAD